MNPHADPHAKDSTTTQTLTTGIVDSQPVDNLSPEQVAARTAQKRQDQGAQPDGTPDNTETKPTGQPSPSQRPKTPPAGSRVDLAPATPSADNNPTPTPNSNTTNTTSQTVGF